MFWFVSTEMGAAVKFSNFFSTSTCEEHAKKHKKSLVKTIQKYSDKLILKVV